MYIIFSIQFALNVVCILLILFGEPTFVGMYACMHACTLVACIHFITVNNSKCVQCIVCIPLLYTHARFDPYVYLMSVGETS